MTTTLHANGQTGRLSTAVVAADTTIYLGGTWTGGSGVARIVLDPPQLGSPNPLMEIITASVSTGSATATGATRGQEGTTPQAHASGAVWAHGPTAADLDLLAPKDTPTFTGTLTAAAATFTGTVTVPASVNPTDAAQKQDIIASSSNVFNVRSYGAKGDGVTDDTTAIQTAMAAAALAAATNPATGAVVFVPAGTYMISSPLVTYNTTTYAFSNVTIQGAGMDATILRAAVGNGSGLFRASGSQGGSIVPFATATAITYLQNFTVQDLTFDGSPNGSILTAMNGQMVSETWVADIAWRRVKFTNGGGGGGRLFNTGVQYNLNNENQRVLFEDCTFCNFANAKHLEAVLLSDTKWVRFVRCEFYNMQYACVGFYQLNDTASFISCRFRSGTPANANAQACQAIRTGASSAVQNLTVFDCDFEEMWGGAAVFLATGGADSYGNLGMHSVRIIANRAVDCDSLCQLGEVDHFEITGNFIQKMQTNGIKIATGGRPTRYGRITNNEFYNCGQAQAGAVGQAAILIQSNASISTDSDVQITGNHFRDDQAVKTCLSGVYLNGAGSTLVHGYLIADNDCIGVPQFMQPNGWQANAGPDFIVRNNRGYNPVGVSSVAYPGSGVPIQNLSNSDETIYLSGGTLTALRAAALPNPLFTPAVSDIAGGGSGWSTSTAYTVALAYQDSAGQTAMGTASASVTPANATDTLLVTSMPIPTTTLTLAAGKGNVVLPTGTYTIGYTFFNEVGETPIGPTANFANATGLPILVSGASGGNLALPAGFGILGINIYVTAFTPSGGYTGPSPLGRIGTVFVTFTGGAYVIQPYTINQLPFGIPAPTGTPVLNSTDMATPGAPTVANAPPVTYQATTVGGNTNSITLPSVSGIYIGMTVVGQDNHIKGGTTVTAISGTTITLSKNTTAGSVSNYNLVFNGQLPAATYAVQITTLDATGETAASATASATVPAGITSNAGTTTYSSTSATDSGASYTPGQYVGWTITQGTHTGIVISNTATTLNLLATAGWSGGTPSNGTAFTLSPNGAVSVAESGLSANATSANLYINTPTASSGFITTVPVAGGAIAAASGVTQPGGGSGVGNAPGTYIVKATYVTMAGESAAGPASTAVNIAPDQPITVAQLALSDLIINLGQLVVLSIRYYVTGGTAGVTGLLGEVPLSLPAVNGGNAYAAAFTSNLEQLLSAAGPPASDFSLPPTNTLGTAQSRSDGWRLPRETGSIITGVQAWVNPGNKTTVVPSGGILQPFAITAPGTTTAGPTTNTTGAVTVATATPCNVRVPAGQCVVATTSANPTVSALVD